MFGPLLEVLSVAMVGVEGKRSWATKLRAEGRKKKGGEK
jgi:hypothetical protein